MSSLNGLKILVTRPTHQATNLSNLIKQAGGEPILFPLLNIRPVDQPELLKQQLSKLAHYHWAIFISPNAASFGLAAITQTQPLPSTLKIAAVGAGTQKTLKQAGIQQITSPAEQFDSEGLLALAEFQDIKNQNIIIFRGETGREQLADTLRQRGAQVDYACCYIREKPNLSLTELLEHKPDVITISSSEAVNYLSELIKTEPQLLQHPLFAPHPRIAERAQQLGWQNIITTPSGDQALLDSIKAWHQNH